MFKFIESVMPTHRLKCVCLPLTLPTVAAYVAYLMGMQVVPAKFTMYGFAA